MTANRSRDWHVANALTGDPTGARLEPAAAPAERLHVVRQGPTTPGESRFDDCLCDCHAQTVPGLRALLRSALERRIAAFGAREVRQRELHEWVVLLVAFAVTTMLAAPALVPLVLALQGQRP